MNLRMFMAGLGQAGGAAALSVNIKPGSVTTSAGNVRVECGDVSAEATGGVPPYTYRWYRSTGSSKVEVKAGTSTAQQMTVESSATDEAVVAFFGCSVTDSVTTSADSNQVSGGCVHGTPT